MATAPYFNKQIIRQIVHFVERGDTKTALMESNNNVFAVSFRAICTALNNPVERLGSEYAENLTRSFYRHPIIP